MQARPWSIQNFRVASLGLDRVNGSQFLAELDPLCKVLGLQLVPVRPLAVLEDGVAGVEVHLGGAWDQLQRLVQIGHQFLRRPGTARVVAGGLDAAGQGLTGVGVEAPHVVPLPAVQADGHGLEPRYGRFRVHAVGGVLLFCFLIAHVSASICIFKFPSAVASIGSATTFLPAACSVRRFKKPFLAPPPTMYILSYFLPVLYSNSSIACR